MNKDALKHYSYLNEGLRREWAWNKYQIKHTV